MWRVLSLSLVIWATCAQAANIVADKIETALDACLSSPEGGSTAGAAACFGYAIDAYDKLLNDIYRHALAALDPGSVERLRDAQRQWLAFRKADLDALSRLPDRGTVLRLDVLDAAKKAYRFRIEELALYIPATD